MARAPVIVQVPEKQGGTQVAINTSEDFSISEQLSSARTYTVDQVFGPGSDQEMFFNGVALPLCEEFIKGYNCTIFSYGQTGAGKTFTMCGEIQEAAEHDSIPRDAGIIPRILSRLFDTLDSSIETIIKCSFVEIYNEELNDLLSGTNSIPRLRIYEQKRKGEPSKSIRIDGLEEFQIHSLHEGISLLREGINRRQTAATRLNDLSSRSHSIFTITLLTKKGQTNTEYRQVKMNLVDLAGSENIGRSGSITMRAKEAGSINQSLLTLGRVINCLVDGDLYIPYRESKLTRLLQDSLGGNTKTVLIANVSPSLTDLQPTLSTLEYASKAKNIKNAVQIGPLISDELLVRQLVEENYRLKLDLKATRRKDGIYMDENNYNNLMLESKNLKSEAKELRRSQETAADQLIQQAMKLKFEIEQKETCLSSLKNLESKVVGYENRLNEQRRSWAALVEVSQKLANLASQDLQKVYCDQQEFVDLVQSRFSDGFNSFALQLTRLVGRLNGDSKDVFTREQIAETAEQMIENSEGIMQSLKELSHRLRASAEVTVRKIDELGELKTLLDDSQHVIQSAVSANGGLIDLAEEENSRLYEFVTGDAIGGNEGQLADELLMFSSDRIKQFQDAFTKNLSDAFKEIALQNTSTLTKIFRSKLTRGAKLWYEKATDLSQQLGTKNKLISKEVSQLASAGESRLTSLIEQMNSTKEENRRAVEILDSSIVKLPKVIDSGHVLEDNSSRLYDREKKTSSGILACADSVGGIVEEIKENLAARCEETKDRNSAMSRELSVLVDGISNGRKRVLGDLQLSDVQDVGKKPKLRDCTNNNVI
ncbi:DEKNAAC100334 [Brettanomyces naardenensis]|uniref:DEKNAAC100334 n=1 Tax=Brettanomyces naardenensis TaxID=13370 RepID=A0A448YFT8_BRENA|nr:DEKNAAC100334 [Brettanomyces naardenensis]